MSRKPLAWVSAGVALLVAFAWWWFGRPAGPGPAPESGAGKGAVSTPAARTPVAVATPVPRKVPSPAETASQLDGILTRLAASGDPREIRRLLAEMKNVLDSLPHDVASLAAQAFLSSRKDAATKLDVTVQPGGALGDASSVRVFLLDYLGQIDRPAAAALGRQILGSPTSPDEWAVSLRNVAWADSTPETLAYLRTKTREMITNPAWRQKPSSGFLEAFDVIVHARGFDLAPELTALVRDRENRTLAHAAYLTLDRLTLADPAAALAPLAAQPELMEGREQTRANFFARLDVSDAPQKVLLESYLLDPRRSPLELQTFAGIYPSANYMISNNLLTTSVTVAHDELAVRDRSALGVVEGWVADPRFAGIQPHLIRVRDRLRKFVEQAAAPPPPR